MQTHALHVQDHATALEEVSPKIDRPCKAAVFKRCLRENSRGKGAQGSGCRSERSLSLSLAGEGAIDFVAGSALTSAPPSTACEND